VFDRLFRTPEDHREGDKGNPNPLFKVDETHHTAPREDRGYVPGDVNHHGRFPYALAAYAVTDFVTENWFPRYVINATPTDGRANRSISSYRVVCLDKNYMLYMNMIIPKAVFAHLEFSNLLSQLAHPSTGSCDYTAVTQRDYYTMSKSLVA